VSEEEFIQDLKMMWFGLYSRNNNKMDSSGFEHIFAGLDRADFFQTPQMFCTFF